MTDMWNASPASKDLARARDVILKERWVLRDYLSRELAPVIPVR